MQELTKIIKSKSFIFVFSSYILFALPIFLENVYYMDDNARALYGYTWSKTGRIFSTFLMNALDLRLSNIIDCAPLGQILGLCVLACVAVYFTQRITRQSSPDWFSLCMCGLPLAVQPFFLENLSYKFDALPMLMAQSCAALASAVPLGWSLRRKMGVCIALIFSVMALYQPGLNTFVGLSLIVFLSDCQQGDSGKAWRSLGVKLVAFAVTGVAYKMLIVRYFVHGDFGSSHAMTVGLHDVSVAQFKENAADALALLIPLLSGGIKPILLGMYLVATVSTLVFGAQYFRKKTSTNIATGLFICSVPFLILFFLSGIMFLLKNAYNLPRTFMSFSAYMIFANLIFLQPFAQKFRWVGLLSTGYFFIIAYSYGNALAENARFQTSHIERIAGFLENAGFETGDDLFLYGNEPQSPIVQNAVAAMPVLDLLIPHQGIHGNDVFGYVLLQGRGINGREHTVQEWKSARTCLNPEYRIYTAADVDVFRKDHTFCVKERLVKAGSSV